MQGVTPLYYNKDQLGSSREVFNQAGSTVGHMRYGAYGRALEASGTLPDKRYAGMFFHKESGLYLTMYRAYSPDAGRWISRDPIGEAGGENIYAYVRGNPLGSIDPLGLVDLNYIPPYDHVDNYVGMGLISSKPGELTVGIHFDGTNFTSPSGDKWSVNDLAERIRRDVDLSKYSVLTLYSCRAGASLNGMASQSERLSEILNFPVYGPTSYVWTKNDQNWPYQGNYGKTPSGGKDKSIVGEWVLSNP